MNLDSRILLGIHQHAASPAMDDAMRFATRGGGTGYVYVVVALLATWALLTRRTPEAIVVVVGVWSAKAFNYVLKLTFERERPHLWHTLVTERSPSMPSGHSAGAAAVACAAILLAWDTRWRIPVAIVAVAYALLIGFTRMYLGVHYPSDVLVGWIVGATWMALLWQVTGRMRTRHPAPPAEHAEHV